MKICRVFIILMTAMIVTAGSVAATPARVASITDRIDGPVRAAVDTQGNLYVTEAAKNKVVIFDNQRRYLKSFTVSYPVGIAVDPAGNIYVGSGASGRKSGYKNSIFIYNSDLALTGSLGAGAGEVGYPNDIAIGSDGKIYVADTTNHVIKVYDPASGTRTSFGGPGSASGMFNRPTGVAVNDTAGTAGEIYVTDRPVVTTASGPTDGARISVFDKNGQFIRSFGQYGNLIGQITSPVGIAVDKAGLLYVTDSFQNVVHVLNPSDGSPVGSGGLYDPAKPMYNPMGVFVSGNGLVNVVSLRGEGNKGRIDVYALDGSVTMEVDPRSLNFIGTQYAGNPDPQTIVIANSGSGTLNWSATADQTWINLGKQDPVGPKSAGGLAVGVNISAFVLGTYKGAITIDSGFGQKQTVGVTVVVGPAPSLNISNGWLNFSTKKGSTPAAQGITLSVANLNGPVNWNVTSDSPSWITISPSSGLISSTTLTSSALISLNTGSLMVGSYSGLLTVTAPGAIGTGSKITVNLTVASSTKISVSTNRPEAKFSITGPATYSGSGSAWSVDDVPAGNYTITFDAVAGYKKPISQTKPLPGDGEVAFNGNYASLQDLAAKRNIVVAKGPDQRNDALVKAYKNNGTPVAFDLAALTTQYGANVAVGDIDGDGVAEIIVGAGDGPSNPATVRIYRADRSMVTEFTPFGTLHGVRVAAADLNGDGLAEIIVSPAGGSENTGKVAVYTYDAAKKKMVATGIEFKAYNSTYGANIAVADIDGTGKPVIVTAPGFGRQNRATVKLWTVDTAPAVGSWTATLLRDISLGGAYGATVAAGDVDGDGKDEVIIGTSGAHAMITIVKADGSRSGFKAFDTNTTLNVAAADLDGDGIAEIIAAHGPDIGQTTDRRPADGNPVGQKVSKHGDAGQRNNEVRVFNASGALNFVIAPFEGAQDGVNVAVGDLGL